MKFVGLDERMSIVPEIRSVCVLILDVICSFYSQFGYFVSFQLVQEADIVHKWRHTVTSMDLWAGSTTYFLVRSF